METDDGEETVSRYAAGKVPLSTPAGAQAQEDPGGGAEEAGFVNPNMVTMIKKGSTMLPIDRVPALAKALESDPALLLRLALEQREGSTAAAAIYEIIGQPITRNEMVWINEIRKASGDTDSRLTSRAGAAVRGVFGK